MESPPVETRRDVEVNRDVIGRNLYVATSWIFNVTHRKRTQIGCTRGNTSIRV
jgi:hypothetical protein